MHAYIHTYIHTYILIHFSLGGGGRVGAEETGYICIYIYIYIYVAAQLPIQPILRWAKPNFRSEVGLDFAGPS